MKKIIVAAIIMLFCGNAIAQECKSPAGTFEIKASLLTATCPGISTSSVLGTMKLNGVACGAKFGTVIQPMGEGCVARLSVLTIFEEKSISGLQIVEITCQEKGKPAQQCHTVHKLAFVPKVEPPKQENSSSPTKQETDSE